MLVEGTTRIRAVHATAVAIEGRALLIFGRSGSGKSRLAAALVAAAKPSRPIMLIGDDRVLLNPTSRGLEVRPHPRLAGFIERRGLGLVAMPWRERAIVAGSAILEGTVPPGAACLGNLPRLALVEGGEGARVMRVLGWWAEIGKETTWCRDVADADAS